jgi:hypothetical protein
LIEIGAVIKPEDTLTRFDQLWKRVESLDENVLDVNLSLCGVHTHSHERMKRRHRD